MPREKAARAQASGAAVGRELLGGGTDVGRTRARARQRVAGGGGTGLGALPALLRRRTRRVHAGRAQPGQKGRQPLLAAQKAGAKGSKYRLPGRCGRGFKPRCGPYQDANLANIWALLGLIQG